ncbi:hypothetical protein Aperf_G00000100279 [Anoplocephala perfoliata]
MFASTGKFTNLFAKSVSAAIAYASDPHGTRPVPGLNGKIHPVGAEPKRRKPYPASSDMSSLTTGIGFNLVHSGSDDVKGAAVSYRGTAGDANRMMAMVVARAIQAFQASNFSLDTVRRLQENGFDFTQLSGEVICRLVTRNFGLGMKMLIDCGIKIDCVDPVSGNSPLILLAAEGLCGPIRFLIGHVSEEHLRHANHDSRSLLSLLLTRGHGNCGCLEALLLRISPFILKNPPDTTNRIILTVTDLLESIKTSTIDRVTGVLNLWISLNFIDLDEIMNHETRAKVNEFLLQRIIGVVIKDCLSGWAAERAISTSIYLISKLIAKLLILRRIGTDFLDACLKELEVTFSIDQPKPLEKVQIQQLEQIQLRITQWRNTFESVAPLKFLTILALRRYLQRAMCSSTMRSSTTGEEFAFHHQLEELDLPLYLNQLVLLQDDVTFQ